MFRLAVFTLAASGCFAQLTKEQKLADFRYLAGIYAKQYASYEWKRQLSGFDGLLIEPWLERAAATDNDLDFYEVCVEYISRYQDSHVPFILPSDFVASLGFTVDIYDGKVLIDSINRARLPAARFPFQIGDELLSVDGRDVEELLFAFAKYAPNSNPRSTRRRAAARIVTRPQSRMPHAPDIGESAQVAIRLDSGVRNFEIPWLKTGTALRSAGPVPSPRKTAETRAAGTAEDSDSPSYMKAWIEAQHSATSEPFGELGSSARTPIYSLPANFVQRLGRAPVDFFFSGTYVADGRRIGFIRIPNYSTTAAAVVQQFEDEMIWFEQNTDGLVVDDMRNPGGFLCFGENLVARMTPYPFRSTGYELRATWSFVNGFYNSLSAARQNRAEQWVIDLYEFLFTQVKQAYEENRGRTGPIPLCTPSLDRQPATDRTGRVVAYTKPMIMLIDEFSTSTGDSVPAMIQDARRGKLFGWRTNGAGGTNITPAAGAFSEANAGVVLGLMTRKEPIATVDFPTSHYLENTGVRPDIEYDYMTRENLMRQGRPFVDAFTDAILREIRAAR